MQTITKNTLFSEYLIKYLERERSFVKESSYAIYNSFTYNKIIPYFNNIKIKELNIEKIQEFSNYLLHHGNSKTNSGLSYKTTKNILIYLTGSIKFLFNQNIIKSFDLTYKVQKNLKPKKLKVFSNDEVIKLRDYLKNSNDIRDLGILITMYSGLRIGEICALQWEDINYNDFSVSINKTIQRIFIKTPTKTTSILSISAPKSVNSNRVIPINAELKYLLVIQKKNKGFILSNCDTPIEPRALRYHFKSVLKKLEIPNKSFHSLRHTFATRLISNTNDFKTVSELLGHSSISITLDIYTHTSKETKLNCINKF